MKVMKVMLSPVPFGVLTRRDDPATPEDERLHDQNSRDVGIAGNVRGWPILSLTSGIVVTAGPYQGYGNAVRIEGDITLTEDRVKLAREPWPKNWFVSQAPVSAGFWTGTARVRVLYGHADRVMVKKGQFVLDYEPIMAMGDSGVSNGIHVHVKMRLLHLPEPMCFVDPLPLFRYREI